MIFNTEGYTEVKHDSAERDRLARDRTFLANERTFLSYIRTSIMLFATGLTLVKLFPVSFLHLVLAGIIVSFAFSILILGVFRFRNMKKDIQSIATNTTSKE